MKRALATILLAALAAGCSGNEDKPGALFHGPGALALFQGIVAHGDGSQRLYLAVANQRGDELRLLDTTDNELVESPGLVFPLSVPTSARPLRMVAAGLYDGLPDALAVVASGSGVVDLVDTWSGTPKIAFSVDLAADFGEALEVLSIAAMPLPDVAGAATPGAARILVGLAAPTGGRLVTLTVGRPGPGNDIVLSSAVIRPLGFDPLAIAGFDADSLARGARADVVYAATRDVLPGTVSGRGIVKATLPADGSATFEAVDAGVTTEALAVARFAPWTFAGGFEATPVERVFALPAAGECGPGRPLRCGLIAIDPDPLTGGRIAALPPIAIPAPATGFLATGRAQDALMAMNPGVGATSALGIVTAADGRAYLVDLARWSIASEAVPAAAVTAASVTEGTGSAIGLWGLDPGGAAPSGAAADLPARVEVTTGFTPTDDWTLAWQGVLPGLGARSARLGRDAGGLWLSVQVGETAPLAVADLVKLGVAVEDTVTVDGGSLACATGAELRVAALVAPDAARPGGAVQLTALPPPAPPLPACLATDPATGTSVPVVATFRAGGLVLTGASWGHAGRPALDLVAPLERPAEHLLDASTSPERYTQLFYLTDRATQPTGPALGIYPAFVDPTCDPAAAVCTTADAPTRGTAIHFSTANGLVPAGRRPVEDGSYKASDLPSGLASCPVPSALAVFVSYTAGFVMEFATGDGLGSTTIIR